MMRKIVQVLAVILMGIQLGVSYAHFMQMPGKLILPLDCYILVQNVVISYRVKLGFIEIPTIICTAIALLLLRKQRLVTVLTLLGLISIVLMFGVWAILIQPINQQIDTWTAATAPSNWSELRYQWHILHLIRLGLAIVGMTALTSALAISKNQTRLGH